MTHYYSILAPDLQKFLALGWLEVARDWRPSVADEIVLIEYKGDFAPMPVEEEEAA